MELQELGDTVDQDDGGDIHFDRAPAPHHGVPDIFLQRCRQFITATTPSCYQRGVWSNLRQVRDTEMCNGIKKTYLDPATTIGTQF